MEDSYGSGSVNCETCPDCGYETELHSAGVHVSENGAVAVFADADRFVCPFCEVSELVYILVLDF
jgi:hypothetical protein